MKRAHPVRKRLGGGMRQSGILAAAALHALDTHLARLAEDHANAKAFADAVDGPAGARVVRPDTNIIMIDLPAGMTSGDVVTRAKAAGALITPWSPSRIRAVTHLDADRSAVTRAAAIVRRAIEESAAAQGR
jgi:threonine aldolase